MPAAVLSPESDLLRLATAGSVDDGKSTLIGRLLFETKNIFDDHLEEVERVSVQRGYEYLNSPMVSALSENRASRSTSPIAISARLRDGSSSPTVRATCSTPATWSPRRPARTSRSS
jgi:hypothetical protein